MLHVGVLAFLVFPALLLLSTRRDRFGESTWAALAVALAYGAGQLRVVVANVRAPHEWDFGSFWLYGHVARLHQNVYDPRAFASVHLPFSFGREFTAAVIGVGFPYPPPSIALFLPLGGSGDIARELALWYVAQLVAFGIAAFALQRAFFPKDGLRGAILVAALTLLLPAFASSTSQAQTNVFLLALLAVAFLSRERAWGALWNVLALWVKPYAIALVLADLAGRSFRRVGVAAFGIVASLVASLFLVGPQTFVTYFTSNPARREPAFAYYEAVNQSLFAFVLRTTHDSLGARVSLSSEPLYLVLAAAVLIATAYFCARYPERTDLAFALSLLAGLLVYPGTLDSYGTIAILPILVLWSHRDTLPFERFGVAGVAAAVVASQGPLHTGLLANAILWICCVGALQAKPGPRPTRLSQLPNAYVP